MNDPKVPWWRLEDPEEVASAVVERIDRLHEKNRELHAKMVNLASLYSEHMPVIDSTRGLKERRYPQPNATQNMTNSNINTWASIVGQARPRPMVLTNGAPYHIQKEAKQINLALLGAFQESRVHEKAEQIPYDAAIFGTAVYKICEEDGRPALERLQPTSVLVDEALIVNGANSACVREIFQRSLHLLDDLVDEHPDLAEEIESVMPKMLGSDANAFQREVHEGWYVKCGKNPRRVYVKMCGDVLLDYKEWKYDWIPFLFVPYTLPIGGIWGRGMAEELEGIQMRVNALYRGLDKALDRHATPVTFVENVTGKLQVTKHEEIGRVVSGAKPHMTLPQQIISSDVVNMIDRHVNAAPFITGVSQMTAMNQMPAGLQSAPAQRAYNVKEARRFRSFSERYNRFFVDLAYMYLDIMKANQKTKKSTYVALESERMVQIDFSKVDYDRGNYQIQIYNSSMEELEVPQRIALLAEMRQAGDLISPREGRKLASFPELARSNYYNDAAMDKAEYVLDELVSGNDAIRPSQYDDNDLVEAILRSGYQRVEMSDATDKDRVLGNIERYLEELFIMKQEAAQAQMEAQMAAQGGMPGMPGAPGEEAIQPDISGQAAQGLDVPFTQGGSSNEGIKL